MLESSLRIVRREKYFYFFIVLFEEIVLAPVTQIPRNIQARSYSTVQKMYMVDGPQK